MRKLNRTVVAGGVLYPAGTPASKDVEAAVTNPEFWDGPTERPAKADAEPGDPKPLKRAAKKAEAKES